MSEPPLIAVVDDDASLRAALETLLRSLGYRSVGYDSAVSFLASDDAGTCRCVISDICMPGMTGLELKRQLHVAGGGVPVILITASTRPDVLARAEASGAHGLLTKPFGVRELMARLTEALAA